MYHLKVCDRGDILPPLATYVISDRTPLNCSLMLKSIVRYIPTYVCRIRNEHALVLMYANIPSLSVMF